MTSSCIICLRSHSDTTLEHIIPRSLGNIHYILPKGKVCSPCNHRFSKYENKVLSSVTFMKERGRLGILHPTNKQKGQVLKPAARNGFLLKMGYEGIYKSRPKLLDRYDLEPVRDYLVTGKILPFLDDHELGKVVEQKSIPRWFQAQRLKSGKMKLEYLITKEQKFFVQFQLGRLVCRARMV